MKRRILIRVLSFILSLTMILGSTGMSAFAESMSDVSENDGIVEITEPAIETPDITSGDIAVEEPDVTSDDIQLPDDAIEEPDETADVSSDDEIVEDIIEDDSDVSENELYGDALGVYYTGKISVKVGDKTKNYEGDKIPEGLEWASTASKAATVTLKSKVTVKNKEFVISGNKVTINLNSYWIEGEIPDNAALDAVVKIKGGAIVTISSSKDGGGIENTADGTNGSIGILVTEDSSVELKNGKVLCNGIGICQRDATGNKGYVKLSGGCISVDGTSKYLYGIKFESPNYKCYISGGQIDVFSEFDDSDVYAAAYGVCAEYNTDIFVSGGGLWVYSYQASSFGIYLKGGNLSFSRAKLESLSFGDNPAYGIAAMTDGCNVTISSGSIETTYEGTGILAAYGIIFNSEGGKLNVKGGLIAVEAHETTGIAMLLGELTVSGGRINARVYLSGHANGITTYTKPIDVKNSEINVITTEGSKGEGIVIKPSNSTLGTKSVESVINNVNIYGASPDDYHADGEVSGIVCGAKCRVRVENSYLSIWGGAGELYGIKTANDNAGKLNLSGNKIVINSTGGSALTNPKVYGIQTGCYTQMCGTTIKVTGEKSAVYGIAGIQGNTSIYADKINVNVKTGDFYTAFGIVGNSYICVTDSKITAKGCEANGIVTIPYESDGENYLSRLELNGNDISVDATGILGESAYGISYGYDDLPTTITPSSVTISGNKITVKRKGTNSVNAVGIDILKTSYAYIDGNIINISNEYLGDAYGIRHNYDGTGTSRLEIVNNKINVSSKHFENESDHSLSKFNIYGIYFESDDSFKLENTEVNISYNMIGDGNEIKGMYLKKNGSSTEFFEIDKCSVNITNSATDHGTGGENINGIHVVNFYATSMANCTVKCINKYPGEAGARAVRIEPRSASDHKTLIEDCDILVDTKNSVFDSNGENTGIYIGASYGDKILKNTNVKVLGSGFGLSLEGDADWNTTKLSLINCNICAKLSADATSEQEAVALYDKFDDDVLIDHSTLSANTKQIYVSGPRGKLTVTSGTVLESFGDGLKIYFKTNNYIIPITTLSKWVDKNKADISDIFSVKYAKLVTKSNIITKLSSKEMVVKGDKIDAAVYVNNALITDSNISDVKWYMDGTVVSDVSAYTKTSLDVQKGFTYFGTHTIGWECIITVGEESDRVYVERGYTYSPLITFKANGGTFADGTTEKSYAIYSWSKSTTPAVTPPAGKIFEGWRYQSTGNLYSGGSTYISNETVLVASYIADGIKIYDNIGPHILCEETTSSGVIILKDVTYTGKAITKNLIIMQGNETYHEGKDFTVSYKNNKKVGTASVTITGKGLLKGTVKAQFKIVPRMLVSRFYIYEDTAAYTGKSITPRMSLLDYAYDDVILKKGTDYTLSYKLNGKPVSAIKKVGDYAVTVTGKGNYQGTFTYTFKVTELIDIKKCDIQFASSFNAGDYYGSETMPEPVVKYKGTTLTKDTDYKLQYLSDENAGNAILKVTGLGSYTGTTFINYKIVGTSISPSAKKVTFAWEDSGSRLYSGECLPGFTLKLKDGTVLVSGTDYNYSWSGNLNDSGKLEKAGTYTLKIEGLKCYSGTIKKTYTIKKIDIAKSYKMDGASYVKNKITAPGAEYAGTYLKTGTIPDIYLQIGTGTSTNYLDDETDYSIKLQNNKKTGTGYVTFTGKGNYTGNFKVPFSIKRADITDLSLDVTAEMAKAGSKVSASKITVYCNYDSYLLKSGTDYTVSYKNSKGVTMKSSDKVKAGDTVTVVITGKNNYYGTITETYTIQKNSLSSVKMSVKDQEVKWNNIKTPVLYNLDSKDITIKAGSKKLVYGVDYKIAEFGTLGEDGKKGYLIIEGIGDYSGTKQVSFKLKQRKFTLASN